MIKLLKTAFRPFLIFAETIARTVSSIIINVLLVIVFYVVFTPVGLLLKIIQSDPLDEKIDISRPSYWKRLTDITKSSESYFKQY